MSDPTDPAFAARRAAARARLAAIDDRGASDPYRRAFFAAVYETAGDDPAQIPWADLAPHPLLAEWLADARPREAGARALDIGCGLGDNAHAIAARGWRVTAFDLSPIAIGWAKKRFDERFGAGIDFRIADLFAPAADWAGGFDLVHECYTLQALAPDAQEEAISAIARFVARHGRLVVIARLRAGGAPAQGPPWPLAYDDVMAFVRHGLVAETIEETIDPSDGMPHWRALFRRPGAR
jgi:SAM-dependent methyltransferase